MTRSDPISSTSQVSASSQSGPTYTQAPSLEAVRAGRACLTLGQTGAAVRSLQDMLDEAGVRPQLSRDGHFGPLTQAAVKAFQSSRGLNIDGLAGPVTFSVLDTVLAQASQATTSTAPDVSTAAAGAASVPQADPALLAGLATPAGAPQASQGPTSAAPVGGAFAPEPGRASGPFAADRATRKAQAEAILRANGQWPPSDGAVYAIQIDQDSPPATASLATRAWYLHSYTGQIDVFEARGGKLVELNARGPFQSAAHPGQFTASRGKFTDVNGDGRPDIASLRSGVYTYHSHTWQNRFNPTETSLPVARDINQDGVVDTQREDRNYTATGIQIHAGDVLGPTSVGCQTMPPSDFEQFRRLVRSGKAPTFTYVLVRRPNTSQGTGTYRW